MLPEGRSVSCGLAGTPCSSCVTDKEAGSERLPDLPKASQQNSPEVGPERQVLNPRLPRTPLHDPALLVPSTAELLGPGEKSRKAGQAAGRAQVGSQALYLPSSVIPGKPQRFSAPVGLRNGQAGAPLPALRGARLVMTEASLPDGAGRPEGTQAVGK